MKLTIGYLVGMHLFSNGLNNSHPVLELNESIMAYQNSFEKSSVAVYKTFSEGGFKLRAGLTTGYYDVQDYKGKRYNVLTATKEGIGLFLVPSYEKNNFVVAMLGDSVNVGITYTFK